MPRKAGKSGAVKGETITIRVSPRQKFSLELMARATNSSISSVVLNAVEPSLRGADCLMTLRDSTEGMGEERVFIPDEVWDPMESDRTVKLAMLEPKLLTPDEDLIWKVVKERSNYWEDSYKKEPDFMAIRRAWDRIKQEAKDLL